MRGGLLQPDSEQVFKDAACVQSGQPGYLTAGQYQFFILPHAL